MYFDDGGVRCIDCRKLYGTSVSVFRRKNDKVNHGENIGTDVSRSFY